LLDTLSTDELYDAETEPEDDVANLVQELNRPTSSSTTQTK
jgi:hypothetical protein